MRVASSSLQLTSDHLEERASARRESLELWVGSRPAAGSDAAERVAPAPDGGAGGGGSEREDAGRCSLSPHDEIDLAILCKAFRLDDRACRGAREIRSAYADGERTAAARAEEVRAAAHAPGPAAARSEGWGLRYELQQISVEREQTAFACSGEVTTADGRTLDVQVALSMERVSAEASEVQLRAGDAARAVDPLVLNLSGAAASLAGTTAFDLDADGDEEQIARLAAGSAYLAMDRNGNGVIDSGRELFGPSTGSGFGELAALDEDRSGWVDEGDRAFSELLLWNPTTGSLASLADAGVGALSTASAATPFELRASGGRLQGQVARTGVYLTEEGGAGTIQHVDLVA